MRSLLAIRASVEGVDSVALTFDDGPHPEGTPAVLERLAERGALATFFLVGEQVERRPALVGEIVAAGHEVALHGHTHRGHLRLSPARCARTFAAGRRRWPRPPGARPGCTARPSGATPRRAWP